MTAWGSAPPLAAPATPPPTEKPPHNPWAGAPTLGSAPPTTGATGEPGNGWKVEPPKHGAASALEGALDVLDVPLGYAEAAAHDIPEMLGSGKGVGYWATHTPSRTAQVQHDLAQGGAHQVAQNDVYFRAGSLKRVLADPNADEGQKAMAQALLKNPWVAAAGDFAGEFLNPSNVLLGPVARAAGWTLKGVNAFAHFFPPVGRAIDSAADFGRSLGDAFHLPRKVSENTAAIVRQNKAGIRSETKANESLQHEVYGGTTQAERLEIWRRAHGDAPMNPADLATAYPHWPGLAKSVPGRLTDGELWNRASLERASYDAADAEQLKRGFTDADNLMEGYFHMRPKVDYNQEAFGRPNPPEWLPRPSGRMARLQWKPTSTESKKFRSPTDILDANEWYANKGKQLITDGFDPANNLLAHLNRVSGNVALDELIKTLAAKAPEAAQELRQPFEEGVIGSTEVTKAGNTRTVPAGYAIRSFIERDANRRATARAVYLAAREIAQRYSLTPEQTRQLIRSHFASPGALSARIDELKRGAQAVQRVGTKSASAAEDVASKMEQRAQERLANRADVELEGQGPYARGAAAGTQAEAVRAARATSPLSGRTIRIARNETGAMLKRGLDLYKKLNDPARDLKGEYAALRDEFHDNLRRSYMERALRGVTPEGYNLVENVPGLSGLERLKYTALKPEMEHYFRQYGAPAPEASGLAAALDRFNALYRIGIITNPFIHPFYNLLWAYVGSGGNPTRLARITRGAANALDHEAEAFGAHAHFAQSTALGGSQARMLLGPLKEAPGVMGKADWLISRMAQANSSLVFERLERNMSSELWDDLWRRNVKNGMEEEQAKRLAGEQVRKAFGDYDNVTAAETHIRSALYFYSWLKTVIPFWLRAGIERPQTVSAPLRALQTHNAVAGDPNVDSEKLGTLYMGQDAQGASIAKSLPLPQRYLSDIGDMIAPRVQGQADLHAGIPERIDPAWKVLKTHLTPALADIAQAGEQQFTKEPQDPDVTPGQVMYDRGAPGLTQIGQVAKYVGENAIPFGMNVGNLARALAETLKGGGPTLVPSALLGGYVYTQRSPQEQRVLNRYMSDFVREYNHAYKAGRTDPERRNQMQANAYARFRKRVDMFLNRARTSQAPSAPLQESLPQ